MASMIPWQQSDNWLERFRTEMNDMFQRYFAPTVSEKGSRLQTTWTPQIDVEEKDNELLVKVDIPGVDPKDVKITVSDSSLVLSGAKKEEKKKEETNYRRVERSVGRFYREIPLPAGTDKEKITADSSKGVLTVTIPKTEAAKPKKINVQSSD